MCVRTGSGRGAAAGAAAGEESMAVEFSGQASPALPLWRATVVGRRHQLRERPCRGLAMPLPFPLPLPLPLPFAGTVATAVIRAVWACMGDESARSLRSAPGPRSIPAWARSISLTNVTSSSGNTEAPIAISRPNSDCAFERSFLTRRFAL